MAFLFKISIDLMIYGNQCTKNICLKLLHPIYLHVHVQYMEHGTSMLYSYFDFRTLLTLYLAIFRYSADCYSMFFWLYDKKFINNA